ncbi:MAG: selenide, water dikinase SelD [Candidatus Latescibacterota bacterium]
MVSIHLLRTIVCFSIEKLSKDVLKSILIGGAEMVREAGAVLVGGHSVNDRKIEYGLSVTGVIHPDGIVTNTGAREGDRLIPTKPIGTGVLATAIKAKMADAASVERLIQITSALNDKAGEIMVRYGAHACTDVTGFGLGGHLLEMARGSKCELVVHADLVPLIDSAADYALTGLIPAGSYSIKHFCEHSTEIDPGVVTVRIDLIFDAQTSGGLVFSLEASKAEECLHALRKAGVHAAAIIGEVTAAHPKGKLVIKQRP